MQSLYNALTYAKENSPFYREQLAHFHFENNEQIVEQLHALPFTTKDDLAQRNRDFLATSKHKIAEYVTTSGTAGSPVTIFLTKNDLQRLAFNEKVALSCTGANEEDIFQLLTTIDRQFMAGLAYYLGVQEMGAGMVRIGPGVPALQWKSIFDNEVTVLIAVPSFIITLIAYAKMNNIDYKQSKVKKIVCIGEALREDDFSLNVLGKRIQQDWDVELYSTYASTEMGAAFTECLAQNGGHLNPDLIHLEVIKEDGSHAQNNEIGEVVVTTLGVEGTPLIRYKTGDLARLHTTTCACGRTTPRLGPIIGRKNQLIKYKGTTIFPNAIYEVFDQQPAVTCYKVEISKDYLGNDMITVLLGKKIENTTEMQLIIADCQAKLKVVPHFVFLEEDYLRSQVFKKNSRKPEKIVFK
ncbi:MAG: AMP-binding protein [Crocinitomicaceae bacterium]